jgi:hypothetical protein
MDHQLSIHHIRLATSTPLPILLQMVLSHTILKIAGMPSLSNQVAHQSTMVLAFMLKDMPNREAIKPAT